LSRKDIETQLITTGIVVIAVPVTIGIFVTLNISKPMFREVVNYIRWNNLIIDYVQLKFRISEFIVDAICGIIVLASASMCIGYIVLYAFTALIYYNCIIDTTNKLR